jgi:hypothetical protein
MEASAVTSRRSPWGRAFLAVIGGAVLLLLAGIVIAAVLAHTKQAVTYRPNSPEGTVQRYLNLLQDGKLDQAYRMTQITDYGPGGTMTRAMFDQQFASWSQTSHQVTLLDPTTVGRGEATVPVQISSFSGGPLGASTDSNRVVFTLTKSGGHWLITGPPYLPGM